MKKRFLALILCAVMALSMIPSVFAETEDKSTRYLEINEENFPDPKLRKWIIEHEVVNGDAETGYYMTQWQVQGVEMISISGLSEGEYMEEYSLKGLELFPSLNELYLEYVYLQPYRFSDIKNLKTVYCEVVCAESLDFSGCPELVSVRWDGGDKDVELNRIDFSNCPKLKRVQTTAKYVNVKNCTSLETLMLLEYLYYGSGYGVAENTNSCPALKYLFCKVNGTIDLSQNTQLEIAMLGGKINSLDLSHNTKLKGLSIGGYYNGINDSDENSIDMFSHDTSAKAKGLKSLDISNTALEYFAINCRETESLSINQNRNLQHIELVTATPSIEFSGNPALDYLYISGKTETIDISSNSELRNLSIKDCPMTSLDVSRNAKLVGLSVANCPMTSLDVSRNAKLAGLGVVNCPMASLDVSRNANLASLDVVNCPMASLDVSQNSQLSTLHVENTPIAELDLSHNPALTSVNVQNNHLVTIDVTNNPEIKEFSGGGQTRLLDCEMEEHDGAYSFDLAGFIGSTPDRISSVCEYYGSTDSYEKEHYEGVVYNQDTGIVTADRRLKTLHYNYNLKCGHLRVTLLFPYNGEIRTEWTSPYSSNAETNRFDDYVQYKGTTPYTLWEEDRAYEPAYCVMTSENIILDSDYYTATFENNDKPGTATLTITMKNSGSTISNWFKLYLPSTEKTDVANMKDGIVLSWDPVLGAKGYVIYRRAWNLISSGWTTFERWNNTTDTTWTDTKTYAGTRYQYGIKAHYDDPMDKFNLGMVGPLKTTSRITTRTLLGLDAGVKQFTARWDGSKTVTGYQIKYSTDPNFKKNVTAIKITRPDAYRTTVKGLKSGTTYYVTVRGYQVFDGMTYFGEWSNVLSCKVK